MSAPEDSAEVHGALRLGWCVAEVRGRNRPGGPQPQGDELPNRQDNVLPLRIERTATELRIEAQAILHKLAGDLGVDTVTVNNQQQSRTGTVRLWQSVASDQQWRKGGHNDLYQQLRGWYELLILGQDPSTLIKPYALLENWHTTVRVLRALWIQLVTASISLVMVIAVITLIPAIPAAHSSSPSWGYWGLSACPPPLFKPGSRTRPKAC